MNDLQINKLSQKVYNEFKIKNEMLRKIITDNKLFELDNLIVYSIFSFAFHMYFFRILLLPKYSEQDIKNIFIICLKKFLNIIDDTNKKNEIIDCINNTFELLDVLMLQVKNAENKEQSIFAMQEIATLFIESVQENENASSDSVAILQIVNYFTFLLTDDKFLAQMDNILNKNLGLGYNKYNNVANKDFGFCTKCGADLDYNKRCTNCGTQYVNTNHLLYIFLTCSILAIIVFFGIYIYSKLNNNITLETTNNSQPHKSLRDAIEDGTYYNYFTDNQ